jgi:hypothetical protein
VQRLCQRRAGNFKRIEQLERRRPRSRAASTYRQDSFGGIAMQSCTLAVRTANDMFTENRV